MAENVKMPQPVFVSSDKTPNEFYKLTLASLAHYKHMIAKCEASYFSIVTTIQYINHKRAYMVKSHVR